MSTNCLVTKLKGNVDNSDLLKLGEIRFDVTGETPVLIQGSGTITVKIISGPAKFYTSEDVLIGTEISASYINCKIKDVSEKSVVSIISKYALTALEGGPGEMVKNIDINFDDLKYSSLKRVSIKNSVVEGNTSVFKDKTSLLSCSVILCTDTLIANPLDFVNNLEIKSILLQSYHIIKQDVRLESFAEAQFANGRRSGTCQISVFDKICSLNNNIIKDIFYTYSDSGVSVQVTKFDNTRFNASYDGSSWTYDN